MRDGAAKRRFLGGAFRVDMDELMIVGRICELVDHFLRDFAPLGTSDFRADCLAQLVERDCVFHSLAIPADVICLVFNP